MKRVTFTRSGGRLIVEPAAGPQRVVPMLDDRGALARALGETILDILDEREVFEAELVEGELVEEEEPSALVRTGGPMGGTAKPRRRRKAQKVSAPGAMGGRGGRRTVKQVVLEDPEMQPRAGEDADTYVRRVGIKVGVEAGRRFWGLLQKVSR